MSCIKNLYNCTSIQLLTSFFVLFQPLTFFEISKKQTFYEYSEQKKKILQNLHKSFQELTYFLIHIEKKKIKKQQKPKLKHNGNNQQNTRNHNEIKKRNRWMDEERK